MGIVAMPAEQKDDLLPDKNLTRRFILLRHRMRPGAIAAGLAGRGGRDAIVPVSAGAVCEAAPGDIDSSAMEMFESLDTLTRMAPGLTMKFLAAVICGGAIGMEREVSGKPAGLRTCIMICLGSTVFTVVGIEMAKTLGGDPTRIAAQIVTGIGFLGAGAIMRQPGGGIGGMTTAAMIWFLSAIGVAIGSGYLLASLGLSIASVIMILSLRRVESVIRQHAARRFEFTFHDSDEARSVLAEVFELYEGALIEFSITADEKDRSLAILHFRFIGTDDVRRDLVTRLYRIPGLKLVHTEPRNRFPWRNGEG